MEKLREKELSAKRAMILFHVALSEHTEAMHFGIEEDGIKAREKAHDALDAYLDNIRAMHRG